jgi:hypothetical protein
VLRDANRFLEWQVLAHPTRYQCTPHLRHPTRY